MSRLVYSHAASARQRQFRYPPPTFRVDGIASDTAPFHGPDKPLDVGAHEIDLVLATGIRWVNRNLGRRQPENQPAAANVDVRQAERIAEERAIGLGVFAV